MSGIVHSTPYSAMAMRSQVNGRGLEKEMEGLISGLWALNGALNYYGMGIGSLNIATGSWIMVPTIGGLGMV